ncbi:lamin tail domain-containing protein [Myxococcus sp. RHSTA-1-4]|uniref:lamin tail domain-containing protein n=1 Tax=Myxococcus sp. RHSTA-1-4 TaxID=2874601 RepID=UPI001CBB5C88|nr:lamin tail domain-containing protein [Myxococcus sp. RHSTA-1-4]MBZ4415477.1 lamin tail domain-containing protein [Myxococcus sp. RHSTA-1-4]
MQISSRLVLAALGAVLLFHAGCSDDPKPCEGDGCGVAPAVCGNNVQEPGEQCDDGNTTDGDGCQADCTPAQVTCGNGSVESTESCDDGNRLDGDACPSNCQQAPTRCAAANAPALASGATCEVTKAGNGARLFTGVVLKDGETLLGGQVLVDEQGVIQCAACDCSTAAGAASATQVSCPTGVISPGLINPHDHITYVDKPYVAAQEKVEERFEHRHDWRTGANGHTEVRNGGSKSGDLVSYQELRHLMAGTTSTAGAGGAPGLLRNLDMSTVARQEGLNEGYSDSDTFPLGDSGGDTLTSGCGYPSLPASGGLPKLAAYLPHVSEGIDARAANEFRCLASGGSDVLFGRTAIIHGIGLTAREMAAMAERGTGLIWSPRSNVALYGDTAMVTAYKRMGVSIALGTDWLQSGSMNMLRELQCADYLNATHYARTFTDEQLWRMATANAADLTDVFEKVGRIEKGKVGDLAIFKLRAFADSPHRAVITANPEDVVLTLRGGKALYGDGALVDALKGPDTCDTLDVCGAAKAVCLQSELGKNLAALRSANSSAYPLFACGTPQNEPVCSPRRASMNEAWLASRNGSTVYTSEVRENDDDGDGLTDDVDNCPAIFNPVRPMDNGAQADADGDRLGDACDPCPLDADSTNCGAAHPADDDGDGVATWRDNCPFLANPNQADRDSDGKGDACDGCPEQAGGTCANADPTDADLDGIVTPGDNCAYAPNPQQTDSDQDGQGDACDPCSVANPDGAACPTTVYDLKIPVNGSVPLLNSKVSLTDVLVTAVNATGNNGYFVQVHPPLPGRGVEHSGIYVYGPKADVAVGDRLDITEATLKVYFGVLELTNVQFTRLSSGNALPAPVVVRSEEVRTNGPRAAALDGVLLELREVFVISGEDTRGSILVDENPSADPARSGLKVDDQAYDFPLPAVGTRYVSLKGVLTYGFNEYRLLPRSARDMRPPLPALTGLSGGPYIRVGSTTGDAFPQVLTVTMASAFPEDVTVAVTSSAPSALGVVGGEVTIPAGQTSAVVKLSPLAQAESVTLTATLGGSSQQATVRVLGENEQATLSRINPAEATLVPGGTVTLTVELDRPAPANTTVALSADPVELGTFSVANGTLAVAENAMQATLSFTVDAGATGTAGTLTAQLGTGSASTTVTVDQSAPRLVSVAATEAGPVAAGGTREFRVTLDRAAPADTVVPLAAIPGNGVSRYGSVPATVTVASGATQATFSFTADAEGGGAGQVSASLYGITRTADLTVTPPPPKLAALTPATATVYFDATQAFTVTLDRPALAGGLTVNLALEPASGLGSLSASTVTIAEGQTSAQVTFTAGSAPAQGQLTATHGGVTQSAAITVAQRPAVDHVVISELSARGVTSDTDEFVELYNPTGSDVDLSGWKLQYKSAAGTTYTGSVDIPNGKRIKAHGYLLIAHTGYTGSPAADVTYDTFGMSAAASGGGHVRIGPNLTASNLNDPNTVDKLGYGTANQPEGTAAPAHPAAGGSLERKARADSTSDTMAEGGADENAGNGQDTDNNFADFVVRSARQPQSSQSPTEQP